VKALLVVENPDRWEVDIPGTDVVSARDYLTDASFSEYRRATVFNLCRTYGYQTLGYYVSLLALARGHRTIPSVSTLQDLRMPHLLRLASDELDELIQSSLRHLRGTEFELSIYFGRNLYRRYDRLCLALFNQFPAPMLRARFTRNGGGAPRGDAPALWKLQRLRPIAASEIPEAHETFLIERAREYLARPRRSRRLKTYRYDLAILRNLEEADPPSDSRALRRFIEAARDVDIDARIIDPDDYGRIAEFDALFIRESTYVNHHTYRFSRRATAEGLVVIDDPESIVRCTNKVFLAEVFARHGIPCPRTLIVDADDAEQVEKQVGLPCVLKVPDSAFSRGVVKVATTAELHERLAEVLEESELAIAQEFTPSDFDWRVGILDGTPLYACKYHMAPGHWQIINHGLRGDRRWGAVDSVPLAQVPRRVLEVARRAARLVGNGLYGVDLKQCGSRVLAMEVNDNPNINSGYEDRELGDELYATIMRCFRARLDARGSARTAS
jgi:glutathione synthase/RimK-type ligase-like ATP-grasp enzyme